MMEARIAYGSWRETSLAITAQDKKFQEEGTQVSAVCQKCCKEVPAVQLGLKRLPFGRGEVWACRGGC